jgi:nitroreductase
MTNQVVSTIQARSSARAYHEREIAEEALQAIIHAGLQAPTARNRQEIHFSVIKGNHPILEELDAEKRTLSGQGVTEHNFFYEAPILIVLSAEVGYRWSAVDAGIAIENMVLAAESMGLGTLIIGCIYDALRGEKGAYFSEALAIPEGYEFQIALAVGYKADDKIPHEYDYERQVTIV